MSLTANDLTRNTFPFHNAGRVYFDIKNSTLFTQLENFDANSLYDNNNYVIPPTETVRGQVRVKMGNLFYDFTPGGKQSFQLKIMYLDKTNQESRTLFSYTGARYPRFDFEDLVPININAYNHGTIILSSARLSPQESAVKNAANGVKNLLIQMSCGELIAEGVFFEQAQAFFAAVHALEHHEIGQTTSTVSTQRDVTDFGKDKTLIPRTQEELAAKLAALYLNEIGVDKKSFQLTIDDFLKATDQTSIIFTDEYLDTLLLTLIDNKRYSLKSVFPDEELKSFFARIKRPSIYEACLAAFIQFFKDIYENLMQTISIGMTYFSEISFFSSSASNVFSNSAFENKI